MNSKKTPARAGLRGGPDRTGHLCPHRRRCLQNGCRSWAVGRADRINAAGGVNARTIELVTLDDSGTPANNVMFFAPMAAADEFRRSLRPNAYSVRPAYAEEATAITRHAETLPESILVISDPAGGAAAIKDLRNRQFRGPIYGFSNTGESLLADLPGPVGAGVDVARVMPKSDSAKFALVRELQADLAAAKLGVIDSLGRVRE